MTDMPTESLPKFTTPAAKLWAAIPSDSKKHLLSKVWCGNCRHEVTITKYTGAIRSGDLLLVGSCSECHGDVARVIEVKRSEESTAVVVGPPRLTEDQALLEMEHLKKESNALNKRRRQLSKKWDEGTITKQEKAEMERLFGKEGDAMLSKYFEAWEKLTNSFTKR